MKMKFESQTFSKRLKSMLKVDFRRLFTMRLFYIMVGTAIIIPILVLIMTTMMDGTVSVDPVTGTETIMEGFKNTWQSIASVSSEKQMSMDLTSMCNINMLYFLVSIFICIFVAEDFRSGFSKTLFTGRSKKEDYIISKSLVGFVGGTFMILAWVTGAIIGGAISGLSFDLGVAGISGLVMCIIAKMLLMLVFVSIYLLMGVIAKQKLWMSIIGSLMIGMLLFMMIPMLTPLDSKITNVFICLIGGIIFSVGIGAISNKILRKTDIV